MALFIITAKSDGKVWYVTAASDRETARKHAKQFGTVVEIAHWESASGEWKLVETYQL